MSFPQFSNLWLTKIFFNFLLWNLGLWHGMFGIDDFFTTKLLQRKNGQDYQCFKCGKWYSTRSIMLRHMNHECGMEKKIQCKLCYKKFRRKWNLEQHQKRIHRKQYRIDQQNMIKNDLENDDDDLDNDEREETKFWESKDRSRTQRFIRKIMMMNKG